jgi:hypothetical protein
VAGVEESVCEVAADESGAAGDEDSHDLIVRIDKLRTRCLF